MRVQILDVHVNTPYEVLTFNKKVIASIPEEDYISEGNVLEIVYNAFGSPMYLGFNVLLSTYLPPGNHGNMTFFFVPILISFNRHIKAFLFKRIKRCVVNPLQCLALKYDSNRLL